MNSSTYGIHIKYFDNEYDNQKSAYYSAKYLDYNIVATGSTWEDALTNVIDAASASIANF